MGQTEYSEPVSLEESEESTEESKVETINESLPKDE